ncbi:hypothetical protein AJ80_06868 [Polytolypa hystricis UAMH7299]|uniref:Xylanolytic transcriptional activator regulatory domain-containing protein n=1 Tax=Polytolypa hystricis (strain UAMH7299) TaxID=1447883 RepID=A0A2B7XSW3_POLH7|nr:hypothetical protein AJ80_06868 [Polytolypa hystricis UAMH7299]
MVGSAPDDLENADATLQELQAVLLMAVFASFRLISPGLWYIAGVAARLAIDLGLHSVSPDIDDKKVDLELNNEGRGCNCENVWISDLRRRLWWCVYSLDRFVAFSVGRPCSIADELISTDFPSLVLDECLTQSGPLLSAHERTCAIRRTTTLHTIISVFGNYSLRSYKSCNTEKFSIVSNNMKEHE